MPRVVKNQPKLTYEGARAVLDAALVRAAVIGVPMIVAVVDDGGHLLAFARQDGAKLSSVQIAIAKAECAALRRQPTGPYQVDGQADLRVSLALAIGSHGKQTPLRGGLPLLVGGVCVGAVGVSNGSEEQDTDVARAGAAALEES
ncbi:MAG TPA: heme-binding protein [Candidatus Nitrosotenuis sp.]|nr:heme-binding protein [Candidatus Nitrosotenuis sp.]